MKVIRKKLLNQIVEQTRVLKRWTSLYSKPTLEECDYLYSYGVVTVRINNLVNYSLER